MDVNPPLVKDISPRGVFTFRYGTSRATPNRLVLLGPCNPKGLHDSCRSSQRSEDRRKSDSISMHPEGGARKAFSCSQNCHSPVWACNELRRYYSTPSGCCVDLEW